MQLNYDGWARALNFEEHALYFMQIEEPRYFRQVIQDFYVGDEERIHLFKRFKAIPFEKNSLVLSDYFHLELNSRKIQNALVKKMDCFFQKNYLETREKIAEMERFIDETLFQSDLPIRRSKDLGSEDYLKAYGLILESEESLLETLLLYMRVLYEVEGIELFIFINLLSYFSVEELSLFLRDCRLQGAYVLSLNSERPSPNLLASTEGILYTIDRDLCEI